MDTAQAVTLIVAVLGGGGVVAGIVALVKLRPEAGQLAVTAAQDALVVQTGVLKNILAENKRLVERIQLLEREISELKDKIVFAYNEEHPDHPFPRFTQGRDYERDRRE